MTAFAKFTVPAALVLMLGYSFASAQSLSMGHQALVNKGLQVEAIVFTAQSGNFNLPRWNESNFTTIDFGPGRYPSAFVPPGATGLPWSRVMRELDGGTYETDLVLPQETPFIPNLGRLQIGNEQDITDPTILANVIASINSLRAKYPNVMLHTTQAGGKHTLAEMRAYMQAAQPDMLMFDTYPFYGNGKPNNLGGSPTNYYVSLEKYRKLGLEGNNGTGSTPIPVGVFVQTFSYPGQYDHVVSESEIRLNSFSSWAFGAKIVEAYVYERNPFSADENAVLFSGTGTGNPTPQFYQMAETNRQSRNLGPALVRLINSGAQMVMGQHKGGIGNLFNVNNSLPSGVSAWTSGNSEVPHLTGISAQNLGTLNSGLRGDVIVGAFEPLDAVFTNPGHEDDVYFMIVNGLSDGEGEASETRQRIRLNFDFGSTGINSLLRLSRLTGNVELVPLTHNSGSLYYLDLELDGGTGDLFKFNNGGTFVPEPAAAGVLVLVSLFGRRRRLAAGPVQRGGLAEQPSPALGSVHESRG